jgi:hypothetical protein
VIRWLRGSGLSLRVQVAVVVLTLLFSAAMIKGARGPTGWIRFLGTYHTSSPDPLWDIPVDGRAFRQAASYVGRGDTYYLWYPAAQTQYSHDLLGAGYDFLTPALPVVKPQDADWIVSYDAPKLVPPGVRAGKAILLEKGIYLVRVKGR